MDSITRQTTETVGALAYDLVQRAKACEHGLVFVDATGDRLDALAAAAACFGGVPVLTFPAWDSLPYDRSPPSPGVVGSRVATLQRLAAEPGRPCLLLTSVRAVMGRVSPPARWAESVLTLAEGDTIDLPALTDRLHAFGYIEDERVDEPGHMAIRAHVIDIFPGDATTPYRMPLVGSVIEVVHRIDAVSQRSEGDHRPALVIRPVVEAVTDEVDMAGLVCPLHYLPGAAVLLHEEAETRLHELRELIEDAYAATARARRTGIGGGYLPLPSQIFTSEAELAALLDEHGATCEPTLGHALALPPLHGTTAVAAAVREALAVGRTVVAAGDDAARLRATLARRHESPVRVAKTWEQAIGGPADCAVILPFDLPAGFVRNGVTVLAAPPHHRRARPAAQLTLEEPPRGGDVVVHRGHGVCRLRGLVGVGTEERVALEFAGGAELLVPVSELSEIWRYGSDAGPIALDRVDGRAWQQRESEIAAEIVVTARELAAAASARAALKAPAITPPVDTYGRFVRRFPFPLSPDQADAIDATLADMRIGRPMDRLVCGDVGFGKTEVALRAAAAAALAGYQVAIVAPTTVLARQHFDTFERRFAGLGVTVAPMLRGSGTAEDREVRAGLADGSVRVVVGTQAIAGDGVRFKNLALVVIDEEQRFGDVQKRQLSQLQNAEGGVHALTMTATPIPRTLQAAMVGLRQISVIATAPVRRRPARTFVLPWDDVVVREALMREHARGGQSFVVCPRIEDTGALARRLAAVAPELSVVTAHGRLKPEALEQAVAEFAAGHHDVLLATNIIEAGLDIPRANTILVTQPDRFGLAQLHQMRGRVGRGARSSFAYLLTEGGKTLAAPTVHRLHTLETQEQLGAGMAISLADMDARGAGDLFGERQAGHLHAIGTELYQYLLAAQLAADRGEARPPVSPSLHTEVSARIPEDLVAEASLRLQLYRRLTRLASPAAVADLAEELTDRFGELPDAVLQLLDLARLRSWCIAHRVVRLDAGPHAVALTPEERSAAAALAESVPLPAKAKDGRVIVQFAVGAPADRLRQLCVAFGLG